jgi:hypothetical protein
MLSFYESWPDAQATVLLNPSLARPANRKAAQFAERLFFVTWKRSESAPWIT